MPLPLKDFPRSGEDVAQRQKGDKVSPKVTERAHPLPCGELPPQRLRGLEMAEHKKALSEAASFFVWSPSSLGLKGASSPFLVGPARRNRWHFSGSLLVPKENNPRPAASTSKSPCPCRAKHAAFASQTGLRLKSPTGAFMPSGHRRPFWFSFVRQKRISPPCDAPPKMHPNCKSKMQAFCVSAQKNCIFIFCPETLQKALTTAFPHAILNT